MPKYVDKWRPEPELACPIPRRVALRWHYLGTAALLAVIYLTLAALFFRRVAVVSAWPSLIPLGVVPLIYFAERRERRLSRLLVSRLYKECHYKAVAPQKEDSA